MYYMVDYFVSNYVVLLNFFIFEFYDFIKLKFYFFKYI